MRRLTLLILFASACGQSGPDPTPPRDRPSSFTSAGLPNGGNGRGGDTAGTPAAGSPSPTPRAVEEADIVKSDEAGHLYIVNEFRGLEVLEVSDPDAPRLLGRSPILGHPVDMYLANGLAYVIVSDYFNWWWDPQAGLSNFHGSQIKVVDVRDPAAPSVLSSFQLEGFVSDTRRVGDVLYAVSNQYSWLTTPGVPGMTEQDLTFVVSIDMADPMDVRQVDRVDFPGAANQIHATSDSLFVAQPHWEYDGRTSIGTTNIQFVDISDPAGRMAKGAAVTVPGYLDNKFQMDAQGNVLRILTHDGGWGAQGSQRLSTFALGGGKLTPLGHLDLPASGGLFGVRFDGDRAYFATLVTRDPLEIADVSDPSQPQLLASLEVDGTLYQIIPRGGRLLTLGTNDGTWQGVRVSLFDVSDGKLPKLLGFAPISGSDTYSWTQAFWDDKALKVIDELGLIAVPFQAWDPNGSKPIQGMRLVQFSDSMVKARGLIDQAGSIQRAVPLGSRLGTLSELSFITSDIDDMSAPRTMGTVELVRNVVDFAKTPSGAVQLLAPRDYWRDGETLRVRTVSAAHVDDGEFIGEVALPETSGRMYPNGDLLYVLGQTWDQQTGATHVRGRVVDVSNPARPRLRGSFELPMDGYTWYYGLYTYPGYDSYTAQVGGTLIALLGGRSLQGRDGQWSSTQILTIVDFGNADAPRVASTTDLGEQWAWGLIADARRVYMTHYEVSGSQLVRDFMDRIDLSDPARPKRLPSVNIPGVLVAVQDGGKRIFTVDYQWDGEHPTNSFDTLAVEGDVAYLDKSLEIPGEMSRAKLANGYAYFTTQTWFWDMTSNVTVETNLRVIDVRRAAEGEMKEVSNQRLGGAYTLREVAAGHLFLETGGFWWWGVGARGGGVASPGGAIACPADGFCGYGGGDSISVFDLGDPAKPRFTTATRLNGWIMSLEVDAHTAYLPSGFYGVQTITLGD